MRPIEIPDDWDDRGLVTFEEFCDFVRTPDAPSATGANAASDPAGPASMAAAASTSPSPGPAAPSARPTTSGRSIHAPSQEKPCD